MTPYRKYAAVLLAITAGLAAAVFSLRAQPQFLQSQPPVLNTSQPPATPGPHPGLHPATSPASAPTPAPNRNLILLDPAHGGPDAGATLGDRTLEKDVTLALSGRLRTALIAAGFTIVTTRDADPTDPLTSDQRAEIANRSRAVACIVLHATATGSGVHLYTSILQPLTPSEDEDPDVPASFVPIPWDMAQSGSVDRSLRLAGNLSAALGTGNLPVVVGRAPIRPLDNLTCPAVAVEVAPLLAAGADATPVTDPNYQQRVIASLTAALKTWRGHAIPAPAGKAPQ